MKQIAFIIALAAATPAAASPFIDYPDDPVAPAEGPVEIVVAPEDLARCQLTLAMVTTPAQPSAAPASVMQIAQPAADDMPVAVCVTEASTPSS